MKNLVNVTLPQRSFKTTHTGFNIHSFFFNVLALREFMKYERQTVSFDSVPQEKKTV